MRPSMALALRREEIHEIAGRFPVENFRVFGSVVHGTDAEGSGLDLLVDALPGATLLDLGGLHEALEALLGVPVDLLTPGEISIVFRDSVLADAKPL